MGGIDHVVARAREAYDQGDYRWVVQVLDHAISAEPQHPAARALMADALEQLGYQAECGPWRNFYLTGAKELRDGVLPTGAPAIESGEAIAAMPLSAIFDSMAVRLKSDRADEKCLTVSFQFSDIEESHRLILRNGVLHHHGTQSSHESDCSVHLSRSTFDEVLDGRCSLTRKVFEGHARIKGSPRKLQRMFQAIEQFEPWYDVVPSKTSSLTTTTFESFSP
jgi:alkyl sulfatase BDS1-like metallo-beta-lactamase superfamily hydrolase